MNPLILSLALTCSAAFSFAQNSNLDFKYAFKVYNLTSFQENTQSISLGTNPYSEVQYTEKTLQILQPTIAFQWSAKKNNFHEVELTSLRFGKFESQTEIPDNINVGNNQLLVGSEVRNLEVSLRYEFIVNFNKSKESKWVPAVGFGVNPYVTHARSIPKTANVYPTRQLNAGVRGFITPRITYNMTSKLFLDLNLPFCVVDSYVNNDQRLDPTLPSEEQTTTTINFLSFPKRFSGRIGIGLKL